MNIKEHLKRIYVIFLDHLQIKLDEWTEDLKWIERDKTKIRFCHDNCSWLQPTERRQTKEKEPHICICYDKILRHRGFHPHIVACEECKNLSVKPDFYFLKNGDRR